VNLPKSLLRNLITNNMSGVYWIAYNQVDDCVEFSEGKLHWYNGNRCWAGSGHSGIVHYNSVYSNYRGGPMQVYLTDDDMF
jgi:hypothetical protein